MGSRLPYLPLSYLWSPHVCQAGSFHLIQPNVLLGPSAPLRISLVCIHWNSFLIYWAELQKLRSYKLTCQEFCTVRFPSTAEGLPARQTCTKLMLGGALHEACPGLMTKDGHMAFCTGVTASSPWQRTLILRVGIFLFRSAWQMIL